MIKKIKSVAVIGSGTMGAGIAALAADKGFKVLLLDISLEAVNKGKEKISGDRNPMLSVPENIKNIEIGTFENDFEKINDYDWICEAVVENIDIKRKIFLDIEKYRSEGSIISSNTSGIPLKDITRDMPERLLEDICITHFFNPVKVMKLCELIPSTHTKPENLNLISNFLTNEMNKGVVNAKDTVNFIGNRIGCFFMLKGLYEGLNARSSGLHIEELDNIVSKPFGIPPTGLYGLIDLIGLDVMDSVGKNLKLNLPENDIGLNFVSLPEAEINLLQNGQLGRKSGGGFYRIKKVNENKVKEVYDLEKKVWRDFIKPISSHNLDILFENSLEGNYAWSVIGSTLLYAADLIPEISEDIVNVDKAMKWGFAWQKGPFEMLDDLGPKKIIDACDNRNIRLPRMLAVLKESGSQTFYANNKFLTYKGNYQNL